MRQDAVAVAGDEARMLPLGDILPTSERQVRPLTTIDREQVGEVWQVVLEEDHRLGGENHGVSDDREPGGSGAQIPAGLKR